MLKYFPILIIIVCLTVSINSAIGANNESEVQAVKKAVKKAYVKGVHIDRNPEAMRKGFHSEFNMLIKQDETIRKMPLEEWAGKIEEIRKKNSGKTSPKVEHKFKFVDVTGNAAVAGIELFKDGVHIYTDYMALYKYSDGWKIVSKTYYRHPKPTN